jgi:hypothetical protein
MGLMGMVMGINGDLFHKEGEIHFFLHLNQGRVQA